MHNKHEKVNRGKNINKYNSIYDNIIQSKRPSDVTKKYFVNWILVAELLCFMERFRDKVNNDDVFAKY